MLLSAVSVLVVAQSSSEIPEGLMNNPVYNMVAGSELGSSALHRYHSNIATITQTQTQTSHSLLLHSNTGNISCLYTQ